jgi:N-acetylglucosaminyl-diphospho-decaprenol L-rhamnosyltransferase
VSQSNISRRAFQERGESRGKTIRAALSTGGERAPESGQDAPDITAVVVSWNVRDLLLTCLQSLQSQAVTEELRVEILVVDNASTDGTFQSVCDLPGVRAVEAGSNLGYGRANNLGFGLATGRHLLVLNPDTAPQRGSLRSLLTFLEQHPQAGIASPRLLNPDGSVQASAFRFPTLLMAVFDLFLLPVVIPGRIRRRILDSRLNGRYPQEATATKPYRIDHPLGACMLVNVEAYREAGGFDPAIHMYSEEVDLAMRFASAGWECWQVPAARVVHVGGGSTRRMPDRMLVELWRSRLYFYSRHRPRGAQIALGAILVLSQVIDACKTLLGLHRGTTTRDVARRCWRRAGALVRLALNS